MNIYEFLGGLVISLGLFIVAIILGVGLNGCSTEGASLTNLEIVVTSPDRGSINADHPIVIKNKYGNDFDIE